MKILLITPAPPRSRFGNRVTALRWVGLLKALGHQVKIATDFEGQTADILVALHAKRSHDAVAAFRARFPGRPVVVVLTGTDLYRDLPDNPQALQSLAWADRLVTLNAKAGEALPPETAGKTITIFQSALPLPKRDTHRTRWFDVCVVGHLREEKEPFLPAMAAATLQKNSRLRILHAGGAMDKAMRQQAEREQRENHRYHWLGNLPRWKVRRLMASSRLMVLPSRMEGGANVISEAIAGGLPVLASKIPGSVGLLGDSYPGYFPPGDVTSLAKLLSQAETNEPYLSELSQAITAIASNFRPETEQAAWENLLAPFKI